VAGAWAQRINIPRQRLVKDDVTLLEIAATMPDSPAELTRARGISENFAKGKSGEGLLAAIRQARALREEEIAANCRRKRPARRPPLPLIALLKVLLAAKSEEHDVAPRLLASDEELFGKPATGQDDVPALNGWRREVFGEAALALRSGQLALGVDGRRVKLIPAG
jgi:ribonuclease D